MKHYRVTSCGKPLHLLADEKDGVLVWPRTRIPLIDRHKLALRSDAAAINALLRKAEFSAATQEKLWEHPLIMQLAFRVPESEA